VPLSRDHAAGRISGKWYLERVGESPEFLCVTSSGAAGWRSNFVPVPEGDTLTDKMLDVMPQLADGSVTLVADPPLTYSTHGIYER